MEWPKLPSHMLNSTTEMQLFSGSNTTVQRDLQKVHFVILIKYL